MSSSEIQMMLGRSAADAVNAQRKENANQRKVCRFWYMDLLHRQQLEGVENHEAGCVCVCNRDRGFYVGRNLDDVNWTKMLAIWKRLSLIDLKGFREVTGRNRQRDILCSTLMSRVSHEHLISTGLRDL